MSVSVVMQIREELNRAQAAAAESYKRGDDPSNRAFHDGMAKGLKRALVICLEEMVSTKDYGSRP